MCGRRFVHGPGVFFIFPSRLASQERHVSAAGFPAFLGGGSLASGQAVDDGRGAFPALDFHSGCCAVASCGGHSMAEARRKEFARSGAGPQPRIFRFRIASVFAGCAGSFPFADGGAHLAVAGGQWAGDSSPGLVGRLLRGRFVESADVSTQAAGDVDRVCLRFFSPVSAGSDGGFLPADDGEAPYSRAVYDDFRPGLPGRRVFHAGIVQRIRPYGREILVQPFVLLRGVGLPGRRFFPQEGASGAGWEKSL